MITHLLKKHIAVFILVIIVTLTAGQNFSMAEPGDLSGFVKDKKQVRVFVKEFVNEPGQSQILSKDVKKSFEDALLRRKAVKFEISKSANSSDIQILGTIKKFQYLKNDPVTTYMSPTGLVLDAMTTENYVTMEVEFVVTDSELNKIIWKDVISTFIKRKMTLDESLLLIYDKIARTFLWKCFGKPR